jgi:hypothetical protein
MLSTILVYAQDVLNIENLDAGVIVEDSVCSDESVNHELESNVSEEHDAITGIENFNMSRSPIMVQSTNSFNNRYGHTGTLSALLWNMHGALRAEAVIHVQNAADHLGLSVTLFDSHGVAVASTGRHTVRFTSGFSIGTGEYPTRNAGRVWTARAEGGLGIRNTTLNNWMTLWGLVTTTPPMIRTLNPLEVQAEANIERFFLSTIRSQSYG